MNDQSTDTRADRIREGVARARAKGVKLGRPRIDQAKERMILEHRQAGLGRNAIARTMNVGAGTIARVLKEHGDPKPRS